MTRRCIIMRINSISQVSQLYNSNQVKRTKSAANVSQMDAISISSTARDYQVAKNALANVPDIREDKVNDLKQSIEDGSYDVSGESFAEELLASYNAKY